MQIQWSLMLTKTYIMWCDQAKWVWSWPNSILHLMIDCIHHCIATFNNRSYWNWSIGSKDMDSWRVAKTIGNKEIICFVWLYLKISICKFRLILLDHVIHILSIDTCTKSYYSKQFFSYTTISSASQYWLVYIRGSLVTTHSAVKMWQIGFSSYTIMPFMFLYQKCIKIKFTDLHISLSPVLLQIRN